MVSIEDNSPPQSLRDVKTMIEHKKLGWVISQGTSKVTPFNQYVLFKHKRDVLIGRLKKHNALEYLARHCQEGNDQHPKGQKKKKKKVPVVYMVLREHDPC